MSCHIHIPPLRERKEDIRPIALFIFESLCKKRKIDWEVSLDEAVLQRLLHCDLKGNVRELRNGLAPAVFDMFREKRSLLMPDDLSFHNEDAPMTAVEAPAVNMDFYASMRRLLILHLETNSHLWKDKDSTDINCLINMKHWKRDMINITYNTIGRNKAVTAKVLDLPLHQFDFINERHRRFRTHS
jgi:transcriptional regulator with AAA-type ATPase domain